jgi:hypothetical protein
MIRGIDSASLCILAGQHEKRDYELGLRCSMRFADSACNLVVSYEVIVRLWVSIIYVKLFYSSWRKYYYPSFCRALYSTVRIRVYRPATVDYSTHYHGQSYARVGLNPMPKSTLFPSKGLRIWPQASGKIFKDDGNWFFLHHRYFLLEEDNPSLRAEMSEEKQSHIPRRVFYNPTTIQLTHIRYQLFW